MLLIGNMWQIKCNYNVDPADVDLTGQGQLKCALNIIWTLLASICPLA